MSTAGEGPGWQEGTASLGRPCGSSSPWGAAHCAHPPRCLSFVVRSLCSAQLLGHMCPGQSGITAPSPATHPHGCNSLMLGAPAGPGELSASPRPFPLGRNATRRRSSVQPRRRGQRSGSSGGPGPGPCTTVPPHTRMVSARLDDGPCCPAGLGAAAHSSAVLCARRVRPFRPSSALLCCGVLVLSPWAVTEPERVPWHFSALVGLGVSWVLCVTVTVLQGGMLGTAPAAWGDAVAALRPGLQQRAGGVGCGLWSRVRPLPSLVGVCAVACHLILQLGGGSAWPLQLLCGLTVAVCAPGCA